MGSNRSLSNLERQEQILRFVEAAQRASITAICENFQVSEATARRDLETLAEQGKVRRVHGGATSLRQAPPELPVYQRMSETADAKQRIGQAAAQLVGEDETIFLGSGTTVLEVARHLTGRKNLTVITNSLLVLNQLAAYDNISLIGLGGMLRRSEQSLIGHITEQALAELRADTVIIGIHGIDAEQGLTNHYLPETMTDRRILQMGKRVVVVADHTKCGRVSTAYVAPVTAVHTLVTDDETPAEFVAALGGRGVQVVQA